MVLPGDSGSLQSGEDVADLDPRALWPELSGWEAVGMEESVFRVRGARGAEGYVRPDDGSAPLLRRLQAGGDVPVPAVLDVRDGWLLLEALPGVPLHRGEVWLGRPGDVVHIVSAALRVLDRGGVTHGDLCLPNILGDPATGGLTGIVDWRYAERFDREIDVAAAVWSCGYNGYGDEVAVAVLRESGWRPASGDEVALLRAVWGELSGPDSPVAGG